MKVSYISNNDVRVSHRRDLYYLEVWFGGPVRRWPLESLVYADVKDIITHHISRHFFYTRVDVVYTDLLNPYSWD